MVGLAGEETHLLYKLLYDLRFIFRLDAFKLGMFREKLAWRPLYRATIIHRIRQDLKEFNFTMSFAPEMI